MKLSPVQLEEFDEVLPPVTSSKGDICTYKVNHKTKHVFIKTGENDGNDQEWRHTGGSYDSIMKMIGRNEKGEVIGDVPAKPVESVPVFPPQSPEDESL